MAHFDIQDFREELRHEFDGNVYSIEPILRGIYAYKLDGVTSLRYHLQHDMTVKKF